MREGGDNVHVRGGGVEFSWAVRLSVCCLLGLYLCHAKYSPNCRICEMSWFGRDFHNNSQIRLLDDFACWQTCNSKYCCQYLINVVLSVSINQQSALSPGKTFLLSLHQHRDDVVEPYSSLFILVINHRIKRYLKCSIWCHFSAKHNSCIISLLRRGGRRCYSVKSWSVSHGISDSRWDLGSHLTTGI